MWRHHNPGIAGVTPPSGSSVVLGLVLFLVNSNWSMKPALPLLTRHLAGWRRNRRDAPLRPRPRGHASRAHPIRQTFSSTTTPPMLRPPPLFARAKINYWETTSTTSTWYLWNCGAICTLSRGTFTPQIRSKVPCCTLYCMQVCFAYLLTSVFPFFSARPNSEETQIPISKKKFMMYVSSTKMHLGARNAFSFSLASAKISRAIERSTFRSQILSGLGRIHPTSSAQIPPLLVHPFCFPPIVVSLLFPPLPLSPKLNLRAGSEKLC